MRHHEIRLPKPAGVARIFVISCLHIGHKAHNGEKALEYRRHILSSPDTYVMSLGDDMENALPGDERHSSMMWDSVMTPEDQYREACEFWLPLAEGGKLLLTHNSNHFWRSQAKTGLNVAEQMNVFLNQNSPAGRRVRFGNWQAMTKLWVGKVPYLVHSQHGSGASATPEAALRKCREAARSIHADIYLRGHHHQLIVFKDVYKTWNTKHNQYAERLFACTGCFLHWDETYGERSGYHPTRQGGVVLELSGKKFDVHARG